MFTVQITPLVVVGISEVLLESVGTDGVYRWSVRPNGVLCLAPGQKMSSGPIPKKSTGAGTLLCPGLLHITQHSGLYSHICDQQQNSGL